MKAASDDQDRPLIASRRGLQHFANRRGHHRLARMGAIGSQHLGGCVLPRKKAIRGHVRDDLFRAALPAAHLDEVIPQLVVIAAPETARHFAQIGAASEVMLRLERLDMQRARLLCGLAFRVLLTGVVQVDKP